MRPYDSGRWNRSSSTRDKSCESFPGAENSAPFRIFPYERSAVTFAYVRVSRRVKKMDLYFRDVESLADSRTKMRKERISRYCLSIIYCTVKQTMHEREIWTRDANTEMENGKIFYLAKINNVNSNKQEILKNNACFKRICICLTMQMRALTMWDQKHFISLEIIFQHKYLIK